MFSCVLNVKLITLTISIEGVTGSQESVLLVCVFPAMEDRGVLNFGFELKKTTLHPSEYIQVYC